MTFRAVFRTRADERMTQPAGKIRVDEMSWSIFGGPEAAHLSTEGHLNALYDLANYLRCPLTVYNAQGTPVWWGFLNQATLEIGDFRLIYSLDSMSNKVAVRYSYLAPLGDRGEVCSTAWAEDAPSQALYGTKETILRRALIDQGFAEQLRDLTLEERALPQAELERIAGGHAQARASLSCLGWMHSLDWIYYMTSAGLIANYAAQNGTQYLGNTYSDLWLAESITPTVDFAIKYVDVRLRKVGSPTDDARVHIQTDSGGSPSGTYLGYALVSPANISSSSYPWLRFTFSTPVSVSAATKYWVVLQRAGAPSTLNYYMAGVDEALSFAGGEFKIYNHVVTSWISRAPDCNLIFRVIGMKETSSQMEDIFAAGNQFLSGISMQAASGVDTTPYQQGVVSCYEELLRYLRLGTSNKRLLLALVKPDRRLVITEQAERGNEDYFMDAAGACYDQYHNPLMAGITPVGKWLRMKEMPQPGLGGRSQAAAFIESAVLDVESGRLELK